MQAPQGWGVALGNPSGVLTRSSWKPWRLWYPSDGIPSKRFTAVGAELVQAGDEVD